jgi:hypothetical protein
MTPPFHEPLRNTILRTGILAIALGAVLARFSGGWTRWPVASLLVLWFSFGGHWVEVWYLNWLRPRLPDARAPQSAARSVVWFGGGILLGFGMRATAALPGFE